MMKNEPKDAYQAEVAYAEGKKRVKTRLQRLLKQRRLAVLSHEVFKKPLAFREEG